MKRIVLTIFAAFLLSACGGGGGGGGAAPSVNSDDSQITATELRAEVEELRKDLGDTPDERRLATKLSELESDIDNARREFKVLLDEIAELRAEWNRIKTADISPPPPPNCGTNEEPNGRNCECVAGYVRQNGVCELPPPNCGANEEPNGRNCECVAGYVRQNGVCELPPPNCGANEEPNGRNCECVAGYVRQNGVCELPPPNCGANEEPNGRNCECVAGYVRKNGVCEPVPPPCSDFRVRDANGECTYDTPEYRGNYALPQIGALHAYNNGFHGQGVTVALLEYGDPQSDHESLVGQVVNSLFPVRPYADRRKESFHATATGGVLVGNRNGITMHGVAPGSKIISLSGCCRVFADVVPYLIDNTLHISSNQEGVSCILRGQFRGMRYFTGRCPSGLSHLTNPQIAERYKPAEESDHIFVQAHGNERWQGLNSTIFLGLCGNQDINENCELPRNPEIITINLGELIDEFNDEFSGELRTLGISPYIGGIYSYPPAHHQLLEDNFIVVVAVDRQSVIADFSNACGDTKRWCIAAPGVSIVTPRRSTLATNQYTNLDGTSFSAPIVSGALAVLKSAAPMISMTVIRQILLDTATPLGSRITTNMPDELYGWGFVNISAGIDRIMTMKTQNGILYDNLRESLPGEFAHLRGRLESVSVALRITDRSFYNMRLSDIVGGGGLAAANIGGAAKEMQTDDYAAGESFRFWGGLDYDGGKSNYIGEGGGIFSAASAEDIGGYMRWTTANYGGISAFGEYGRTAIKADYGGNPLIAAVDNARAEEWTMGIQYRDLWRKNDNIILSARQESRISGGNMILRYPVADGDSHKAFIGETPQTIRTETTRIPIKQKPQTIWTLGYSQQTDNGKWSAATEWNLAKNESAFSFAIELQIR